MRHRIPIDDLHRNWTRYVHARPKWLHDFDAHRHGLRVYVQLSVEFMRLSVLHLPMYFRCCGFYRHWHKHPHSHEHDEKLFARAH